MEAALIKSRLSDDSDGQTSDGAHKHAFPYSNHVESTIHQPQAGPPFFQERSSLIGLSILVHKLAVELMVNYKIVVLFPHYTLRMRKIINRSMQHVSLSGRPYPNIVHNVQSPGLF